MLYQIYEAQFVAAAPASFFSWMMRETMQNPALPFANTAWGRSVAAAADMTHRMTRQYVKPEWKRPVEKVLRRRFGDLIHFTGPGTGKGPKVLLVAPLSGHHATLLRGMINDMAPDHDVYATDWCNARMVPVSAGPYGFEEHVEDLMVFLETLGESTHIIGLCQPGPAILSAVSLLCQQNFAPRSMTFIGSPMDTRANRTGVNIFAESRPLGFFKRNLTAYVPHYYPGFMRRVYPGFMQLAGFMSMDMDRHVDAHVKYFQSLIDGDGDSARHHREFYDDYLSVMDLPGEFYLDTIRLVFKEHALPKGTLTWRGAKVDPSGISQTALMTVEGERDIIAAPGQTRAAHDMCPNIPDSKRAHLVQPGVGHFGTFHGRRWREEILPKLAAFLREQTA